MVEKLYKLAKEFVKEYELNYIPKNQKNDFQVGSEISEEDANYLLDVVEKKEKEYSEDVKMTYINCLEFFLEHLHPKTDNQKNSWLDTIDKLNRIDKIPFSEIERITKEARSDDFWSKNFLSLTKLRLKNKEKVPYIVVFNEKFKKSSKQEDASDILMRRYNLK